MLPNRYSHFLIPFTLFQHEIDDSTPPPFSWYQLPTSCLDPLTSRWFHTPSFLLIPVTHLLPGSSDFPSVIVSLLSSRALDQVSNKDSLTFLPFSRTSLVFPSLLSFQIGMKTHCCLLLLKKKILSCRPLLTPHPSLRIADSWLQPVSGCETPLSSPPWLLYWLSALYFQVRFLDTQLPMGISFWICNSCLSGCLTQCQSPPPLAPVPPLLLCLLSFHLSQLLKPKPGSHESPLPFLIFHISHPTNQQILLALPSKHTWDLATSYHIPANLQVSKPWTFLLIVLLLPSLVAISILTAFLFLTMPHKEGS